MIVTLAHRALASTIAEAESAPTSLTGAISRGSLESVSGWTSDAVAGFAPTLAGIVALMLTKRPMPCNPNARQGKQQ